jgi:phosphoribosylanthranilate isomerase
VCGVRRIADARLAAELGATHIGCVVTRDAPRQAGINEVRDIAEAVDDLAHVVLVFRSPSTSEVLRACTESGIYHVQVQGGDDAFCELLEGEGLVVYRAHAIDPQRPRLPRMHVEPSLLRPALIDAAGGLDVGPCIWTRLLVPPPPFTFLCGGITAENVAAVLARGAHGVDVTASVESAPGEKSRALLQRFFAAATTATKGDATGAD